MDNAILCGMKNCAPERIMAAAPCDDAYAVKQGMH